MLRFLLRLFCVAFALQLVNGRALTDDGRFEIKDGNCDNAKTTERVFANHVTKIGLPFITQKADVSWYGDETIYCLMVTSELDESEGSLAYITEGGVDHKFMKVELVSKMGHGLDYMIRVFAK
ncbi:uncharacterized protein LOC130894786 [Diorhabda carinulata]|uniref:uncharacterized protein LOC130894786 n=1 Tax=Diorhabda carinulata TaxID=1163345 RepID=UPI0025A1AE98|nr:uncharacterized protein LOC130894786 [Diorhabda carinulata]